MKTSQIFICDSCGTFLLAWLLACMGVMKVESLKLEGRFLKAREFLSFFFYVIFHTSCCFLFPQYYLFQWKSLWYMDWQTIFLGTLALQKKYRPKCIQLSASSNLQNCCWRMTEKGFLEFKMMFVTLSCPLHLMVGISKLSHLEFGRVVRWE